MLFGIFLGVTGTYAWMRFRPVLIALFKTTERKIEKAIEDASK